MRYLLIVCLLLLLPCPSARALDGAPAADTAVLVNNAVITTADFQTELERVVRQRKKIEKEFNPNALALLKKESLETLIGRELLYQESKRKGIHIAPSAVELEITRLRNQYSKEADYKSTLASLGMTEDRIRTQVERGMAIQAFIDTTFKTRVTVTESDARYYYNTHQAAYAKPQVQPAGPQAESIYPFEEVREKITRQLQRERTVDEVTRYLKHLRDTARVEIHMTEE